MNSVDFSMWGKALRTIPKVNHDEWLRLDLISKWLIASRSAVFLMTAIAAAIGGVLAAADGSFNPLHFIVAFVGLVMAHATNNLMNDYIDASRGVDHDNYYRNLYGPQTVQQGWLTKGQMVTYISVSLVIALSCGLFLVWQTGMTTLYLLLAGLFFVIFYTWPLKYIGLGEPTVVLVWGPLMVGGTYFVTTGGMWSWPVAIIGLIYALGPTSVLLGKHTDKLPQDKAKKVYTLPVILGETAARWLTIGLWGVQYLLCAWLVVQGSVHFSLLVVILAIPSLIKTSRIFSKKRPDAPPEWLEEGVWPLFLSAHAFQYNKKFGTLFLLGLIVDLVISLM